MRRPSFCICPNPQAGVLQLPGQGLASASSDDNGTAAAAAAAAAPAAAAAAAAVPSSWSSRLAALRAYLMSATAKDCGIMVTLQRAQPTTDTNGNRNGDNADGGAAAAGGGDGGGDGTAATGRRRRPWARLLALPRDAAGGWGEVCAVSEAAAAPPDSVLYMYKVRLWVHGSSLGLLAWVVLWSTCMRGGVCVRVALMLPEELCELLCRNAGGRHALSRRSGMPVPLRSGHGCTVHLPHASEILNLGVMLLDIIHCLLLLWP